MSKPTNHPTGLTDEPQIHVFELDIIEATTGEETSIQVYTAHRLRSTGPQLARLLAHALLIHADTAADPQSQGEHQVTFDPDHRPAL